MLTFRRRTAPLSLRGTLGLAVALSLLLWLLLAGGAFLVARAAGASSTTTTGPLTCQSGSALRAAIAKAKPATATAPAVAAQLSGCYDTTGTTTLKGLVGITIDGNGASITESLQPLDGPGVQHPVLAIDDDTGVTISDLKLNGSHRSKDGGVNYEADGGVIFSDSHGISLDAVSVGSVQGDATELLPAPNDDLNTGITWTDSTLAGTYHSVVIEAADGATFEGDTLTAGTDLIDLEQDDYSTVFKDGLPTFAAEDDITFEGDTLGWLGNGDVFASIQAQSPGIQEQGVRLIDNRITASAPLLQLVGSSTTVPRYQLSGFVFEGNTMTGAGAKGTSSGAGASAMTIAHATDVTIQANDLPFYGTPKPYLDALKANAVTGLTVSANRLPGALGVLSPSSSDNTSTAVCANRFGVGAESVDAICP